MKYKPKYSVFHKKARKFFGKGYCECCGITEQLNLKVNKRKLDMHCLGDYTKMIDGNWKTLCLGCHRKQQDVELKDYQIKKILNHSLNRYQCIKHKKVIQLKPHKPSPKRHPKQITVNMSEELFEYIKYISENQDVSLSTAARELLIYGLSLRRCA